MNKFNVDWIYVLDEVVEFSSRLRLEENYLFWDEKKKKVRMVILKDGRIFLKPKYAWDGCTPKFCLWDIYFGIPDGAVHSDTLKPKTYYASLFHDALYQYLEKDRPYTRKDGDRVFLEIMGKYNFRLKCVYYLGVRIFGGLARLISKYLRKNSGRVETVPDAHPEILQILNAASRKV